MKPLFREPKEPIQVFILNDGYYVAQEEHYCAHCGRIHSTYKFAKGCCAQSVCENCGCDVHQYHIRCRSCSDAATLAKAELIQDYDGPLFDEDKDRFYENEEEYIDSNFHKEECDLPEYLYACDERKLSESDSGDLVHNFLESILTDDYHDEAMSELNCVNELEKAVEDWLGKQTLVSWFPDYKRKIKAPPIPKEE